ncbi:hypothetical protein Taro_012706 [Colocasia esculenta]|uniref:Uncharacterized protein n=1 Tax=Colocasia esculenta TaxID=4460 RepID=A0A843U9W2_COLES|nr:hypothetical protein [Colocasia esculenta]
MGSGSTVRAGVGVAQGGLPLAAGAAGAAARHGRPPPHVVSASAGSSGPPPPSCPALMAERSTGGGWQPPHPRFSDEDGVERFVFGAAPSMKEVVEAVSTIQQTLFPFTSPENAQGHLSSVVEKGTEDGTIITDAMNRVQSSETKSDWIGHVRQVYGDNTIQQQAYNKGIEAFRLLQIDPSVQWGLIPPLGVNTTSHLHGRRRQGVCASVGRLHGKEYIFVTSGVFVPPQGNMPLRMSFVTPEDLNRSLDVCHFMTPEDLSMRLDVCRFMTSEDLEHVPRGSCNNLWRLYEASAGGPGQGDSTNGCRRPPPTRAAYISSRTDHTRANRSGLQVPAQRRKLRTVLSLSSDKAVWDAVLKNEAVKELRESIFAAGNAKSRSSGDGHDVLARLLEWIIECAKAKVMELAKKIAKTVNELLSFHEKDKLGEMDLSEDALRSSFMLSILVFILVIITRFQKALPV